MNKLLPQLLRVIALRSGPQDLPGGWSIAALAVLAYIGLGVFADRLMDLGDTSPRSLVSIGLQIGAIYVLLRFRGYSLRVPQTITAAAGTGSIFGLASILLIAQSAGGSLPPGVTTLWLGLFIWSLVVDGHIYRSALSTTMSIGMMIAVLMFTLNFIVIDALFPAAQSG